MWVHGKERKEYKQWGIEDRRSKQMSERLAILCVCVRVCMRACVFVCICVSRAIVCACVHVYACSFLSESIVRAGSAVSLFNGQCLWFCVLTIILSSSFQMQSYFVCSYLVVSWNVPQSATSNMCWHETESILPTAVFFWLLLRVNAELF